MEPLNIEIINSLLLSDSSGQVAKEDDEIEYKEKYENGSKEAKAKYAKEMAALYNYGGGYLIFGVNDNRELAGLKNFEEPDNASIVDDLNGYFSPAIRFQSKSVSIDGKLFFIIYVEKRKSIPTVCIKGHQEVIKEATIYWRYAAQSSPIRSGDLISLLNSLQGETQKELVEIQTKEFKSRFRPRFRLNTLQKDDREVKFTIINDGEVAHIEDFVIIESNAAQIFPPTWKNYSVRKSASFKPVVSYSGEDLRALNFILAINYHDDEGHKYQDLVIFTKGKIDIKSNAI